MVLSDLINPGYLYALHILIKPTTMNALYQNSIFFSYICRLDLDIGSNSFNAMQH